MEEKIEEENYFYKKESINLSKIKTNGIILDIGGEDEGIIGKMNKIKIYLLRWPRKLA